MHITHSIVYILFVANSVHYYYYYYYLRGFLSINLRYCNEFCFSFL